MEATGAVATREATPAEVATGVAETRVEVATGVVATPAEGVIGEATPAAIPAAVTPAEEGAGDMVRGNLFGGLSLRRAPALFGLLFGLAGAGVALSQNRQEANPPAAPGPDDRRLLLQDEIEIATARVRGKRAEVRLADARLAQVRAVLASVEGMAKRGNLPESSRAAARLDALEHEALLEMRQSELKEREIRLAALQRGAARGRPREADAAAVPDDLPLRLDWIERRIGEVESERAIRKRIDYLRR
jgi:hypothetical protein